MRKQFPVLEVIGGVSGIVATAFFMWQRFNPWSPPSGVPPGFYSKQLAGNIIFTFILLVPFMAIIAAAFTLPSRSRWPILLSSSILSLLWFKASGVADNFPDFPHPHPAPQMFSQSMELFFPVAAVLIIATGLSIRHRIIQTISLRKAIILGALSIFAACLLGASLYILFLHQESELWTRTVPNGSSLPYGEWIRVADAWHIPQLATNGLAQEIANFGVASPMMAGISAGLLALGILSFVILVRIARQSNPGSVSSTQ
jgi:hypothetical protein